MFLRFIRFANNTISKISTIKTVSYTHLDVYKRQVMQMAYHEDRARKTADIATEMKNKTQANMFKPSL